MAAAVDCQALDSDHCCPVECSRVQSIAVVLVEPVISDVGPTNARNGLCRPVSEPPADGLSSRGHSWSLFFKGFPLENQLVDVGEKREQHTRPKRDIENHHQMF